MVSSPRPVSAPSGDWRRATQRDDVHVDSPSDTTSFLHTNQHEFPVGARPKGSLHFESHPTRSNIATGVSTPGQPIQRSLTINETRPSRSPLLHASPDPPGHENPWEQKMLLTLDGGGVRGYSSLLILQALMIAIARSEQESPVACSSTSPLEAHVGQNGSVSTPASHGLTKNIPSLGPTSPSSVYLPCHYFDYMAGTSTGGLIAIMLGRLRMNVDDCITEYETFAKRVFGRPRTGHIRSFLWWPRDKYDSRNLEDVIEDVVKRRSTTRAAEAMFPANEEMCRTIVVAWQKFFLQGVRVPYLFRTYRHIKGPGINPLERNPDHIDNYPIRRVARATSAAPFYFKSVKLGRGDEFEFVDGGFGANNPSEEAYEEVKMMNSDRDTALGALVSIGTGKDTESKPLRGAGLQMYYAYANVAKKWATYSENTHETVLKLTRNKVPYFRLNVERGLGSMKLDEFKTKRDRHITLEKIKNATDAYLDTDEVKNQIGDCARILVARRRRRAQQDYLDQWERFCFGVEYCCRFPECILGNRLVYATRAQLRQHLHDMHRNPTSDALHGETIDFWLDQGRFYPH